MRCQLCGLPDPYNGAGDGIGSCECPRCECCGAGPQECDCGQDWDEYSAWQDDDDTFDPLCNDTACPRRQHRITQKNPAQAALKDLAEREVD